ncbi:MAG: hypothetical protein AB8G99_06760 [Planctomycetaceae bacterium]
MTNALAETAMDRLRSLGAVSDAYEKTARRLTEDGWAVLSETSNSMLLVGVPGLPLATQVAWLDGIVVGVWPRLAIERQRLAIISSRLTRKLGGHPDWFDAFRTLACQIDADRQLLITADGTTSDRFVHRASKLFGLPLCSIRLSNQQPVEVIETFGAKSDGDIHLSRLIPNKDNGPISGPIADRTLIAVANQLRALRVTSGSNTERLLRTRLNDTSFPAASIHVSRDAEASLVLAESGAVTRVFLRAEGGSSEQDPSVASPCQSEPPFDNYLLHWTRSPDGPWPDEEEADYLDNLILGVEATDRTAFAALARILQMKRLIASSHLIRGGFEVVCFSQLSLDQLIERRVYRRHLHRWDFEPYGIGIRKSVLTELGAKPVTYAASETFEELDQTERPFFQSVGTESGVNWRHENEWRHVGDVSLSRIAPNAAFVFAPTEQEASTLSELSGWPGVVVKK